MFSGGCRKMKTRPTKPRSVSVMVECKKIPYVGFDWSDKTRDFMNQLEEVF